MSARLARPDEADLLGLAYGLPVLRVTRLALAEDTPVEVNDMVLAADRYELLYRWAAD
ncbi:UTRA domain-containing protein [Goodfellowiella coeruleoviolacea]|uniref:UTRA domain-containing protein n=1 Tax=Goodfellowiella coeruleoviolacea TaxID=334858 RepID=A0AAE3KHG2_9PSEU|nr:UTRA domain-containing protein [Goodfellowiella coeruleoviolacea]